MVESKDNISSICSKLKNENKELISFNGQSITFRLSSKELRKFYYIKCLEH